MLLLELGREQGLLLDRLSAKKDSEIPETGNEKGGCMEQAKPTWRFSKTVWISNFVELLERVGWYCMFIALTLYLTRVVGFSDVAVGWIVGLFAAILYFLPSIMGAWADKVGFRNALMTSLALLTVGYWLLGALAFKWSAILSLILIMVGAAIFKPVLSGTMAKCSDAVNRARVFSIFYMAVNIGAFSGKMVARELRMSMGLEYINYFAAAVCLFGLIIVALFYNNVDHKRTGKKGSEILKGLWHVIKDVRYIVFLIIVGGFWSIQGQAYATMPKYVLRLVGESASPEWISNVNPLVVMIFVIPVTQLVRKIRPISSMMIAFLIMPISALAVAASPWLEAIGGPSIKVIGNIGMHPVTILMAVGVGLQGLGECFLQPRFFEYISKQAPEGEIGLYMGYSYLKSFFSYIFTFVLSGYLLAAYCPDPKTLTPEEMTTAYADAHYIWYVYAGIGLVTFFALVLFNYVTRRIDRARGVISDLH